MILVALILAGLFVVFLIAWAIDYAREAAFWRRLTRERKRATRREEG